MNALSLHRKIVSSYQDYIRSFIDIRDDDIRDRVEEELANETPLARTADPVQSILREKPLR